MSPEEQTSLPDLLRAESAEWEELEGFVEGLSPEQATMPGYLPGWSVKDFLAHLAGWLAEAGQVLQQIRSGIPTDSADRDVDGSVDARNDVFVEANRDQPLPVVLFEVKMARRRLLHHLHALTEIPPAAEAALRKAGPQHYAQHLPRLREWVAELGAGAVAGHE
jgi:Mycothiol maleylpyruvate isomerase N-terminal domain